MFHKLDHGEEVNLGSAKHDVCHLFPKPKTWGTSDTHRAYQNPDSPTSMV